MMVKLYRLTCDSCGHSTPPYSKVPELRTASIKVWGWIRRRAQGDQPAADICSRCKTKP